MMILVIQKAGLKMRAARAKASRSGSLNSSQSTILIQTLGAIRTGKVVRMTTREQFSLIRLELDEMIMTIARMRGEMSRIKPSPGIGDE